MELYLFIYLCDKNFGFKDSCKGFMAGYCVKVGYTYLGHVFQVLNEDSRFLSS